MISFKQRMQPIVDAMPDGDDKTKLQALVDAQDAVEQPNSQPKQRAQALRRLALLDLWSCDTPKNHKSSDSPATLRYKLRITCTGLCILFTNKLVNPVND